MTREGGGRPQDLGAGVWSIDSRMGGYSGITASYLITGPRPCLVETGTALSAPTVCAQLEALGVEPAELATIVVTHIHLDHAGGVGDLAARFPKARVVVHAAGARHLVDPSRLLASAARVFGPDLDALFGPLRPVPAERLDAVTGTGSIDLGGGRSLELFDAPGHARHHLGLLDSGSGDLYVGDAAGVWIPETATLRPTTPPPDFDCDAALDTLARFAERRPTRLLFSHFGPVEPVAESLLQAAAELEVWTTLVRGARADGLDLDHALERVLAGTADRYAALLADTDAAAKFERLSSSAANVAGIWHWLERLEAAAPER